jgi:hypothetical protein
LIPFSGIDTEQTMALAIKVKRVTVDHSCRVRCRSAARQAQNENNA